MKKCEKIDLKSHNCTWEALPDMREGRDCFNPCQFKGFVYVCGRGSQLVEAFSPQTDSFLPFPLQIPENSRCCLYVHNSFLVVQSEAYITKFAAGEAGKLVPHSQVRSTARVSNYSNSQPVVDPTLGILFIFQKDKVLSIMMETSVEVKSFA